MRSIRIGIAALSFVPAPCLVAQSLPAPDQYQVRVFDVLDGLPVSDVRGVVQAPDGYLYVATGRGLARYDGYTFEDIPLPLFDDVVNRIAIGPRGRVWVTSVTNGMVGYVDGADFRLVVLSAGNIRHLVGTSDGSIWLSTDGALYRLDPEDEVPYVRYTAADGLPSDEVVRVDELDDSTILVITRAGVARVEIGSDGDVGLTTVLRADLGLVGGHATAHGLWLAWRGRLDLLRYDGRTFRRVTGDAARRAAEREGIGSVLDVITDSVHVRLEGVAAAAGLLEARYPVRDGSSWLVVRAPDIDRRFLVHERDGRHETISLSEHLDFRRIGPVQQDDEGSVWIPTDRGLVQLSPQRVYALRRRHGLAESFTTAVRQARDGTVLVGSWGGGLSVFDGGRLRERFTRADGLPSNEIRGIYEAADGTIWVGAQGGFAAIRNGRIVRTVSIEHRAMQAVAEAPDGSLWIGGETALHRVVDDVATRHRPEFWKDKVIWALHVDRRGALWIGTEQHGIYRVDGDDITGFGAEDGLRSDFVVSIYEEDDGTLWFGTYYGGLHRYRGGRFTPVTTAEGLHRDGVWRILPDERGGLWMSSDHGIFRVERDRLHAVADAVERGERPAEPLRPVVFTEAEGAPNRESNRASPGGWRLRDGTLVFNNIGGLVVIDPERALAPLPVPRVALRRVEVDGTPYAAPLGPDALAGDVKRLSFDFAALSFTAPGQNHYRYRLDGYDDAWVDGGTRHTATYTNLRPGRYTFRVQARTGAGEWSEATVLHAFMVRPLLWQSWPVRLALLTALMATLVAAYRYRVRRLLELERLRLRIASDLHDDVGSNLSSIALLSEMLRDSEKLDGLGQRQLGRIHSAAAETIAGLRDIIWLVDPKHDNLADLVHKMRSTASHLLNGARFTLRAPEPLDRRPLETGFVRHVLLLYKEALHNVAKHARASRVEVTVALERGRFELRIRDDGVGFDERRITPGHGLASMRRRARSAGGAIEIASEPEAGTTIAFRAKVG